MPVPLPVRIGEPFGRLRVIALAPNVGRRRAVLCRCACGVEKVLRLEDLRSGGVQSCGCLRRENTADLKRKHSHLDGGRRSPEYVIWTGMRKRCRDPHCRQWKNYGGRGVTVDPRWDDFAAFLRDIGERPTPQHSLDRIDNDGPYSSENCRWATRKQQARNSRKNRYIEYKGRRATISEWAEELGVGEATIRTRLNLGWSIEKALTTSLAAGRWHPAAAPLPCIAPA